MPPASSARRLPRHPASALAEHWTSIDGVDVFYRESPGPPLARAMVHVHGFGLSGRYLLPTAELLREEFRTLVPDLPGFGRSGKPPVALDVSGLAEAAVRFLDDRDIARTTLVGNSMGCPVIWELAHRHPERVDRAILVSPAGGVHNQPLRRAIRQLAQDGSREPRKLMQVAAPDYVRFGIPSTRRLFQALTGYPMVERMHELDVPTLVVVGSRDPLMPGPSRVKELSRQSEHHVQLVVIDGAAHAINFSYPGELANVIRLFMADQPIIDDPSAPGSARAFEVYRGKLLPPTHPSPRDDEDEG